MSYPSKVCARSRRSRRAVRAALAAATLVVALPAAAPALAGSSAVIFMYHRFGEDAYPSTSVRIEQLEAHIKELTSGRYHVMPVPDIVAAIREGRDLPDRTIGLTIDDAFESVYTEAWPRLKKAGLPFTVFVSTEPIDRGYKAFMTWPQLRELAEAGVTIGNHTVTHLHMTNATAEQNAEEIAKADQRFAKELGKKPVLFAYPYGESSLAVSRQVANAGFVAAFGQHSGVMQTGNDYYYLPRFAMNTTYGNSNRFNLAANALPLEVRDITPVDPLLTNATNPPAIGFTVGGAALKTVSSIACYASGQGATDIKRFGKGRVEVRLSEAFPVGRARINCTMPTREGRWRWFGMQFYVPRQG